MRSHIQRLLFFVGLSFFLFLLFFTFNSRVFWQSAENEGSQVENGIFFCCRVADNDKFLPQRSQIEFIPQLWLWCTQACRRAPEKSSYGTRQTQPMNTITVSHFKVKKAVSMIMFTRSEIQLWRCITKFISIKHWFNWTCADKKENIKFDIQHNGWCMSSFFQIVQIWWPHLVCIHLQGDLLIPTVYSNKYVGRL